MNILFISSQPFPYGMAASKRIRLFAEYMAINNKVKVLVIGKNNDRNNGSGIQKRVEWVFIKFYRLQLLFGWLKIKLILKQNFIISKQNVIMQYDGIGLTNLLFAVKGRRLGYSIFTDIVEDYSLHRENTSFLLSVLHKLNIYFNKR